ncbi:hypothetical protein PoB_006985600 [Plakobranchus ocellatus]|uniref:Uncharacterized protein n=1 Tax=Plakobranchus ocellatus TaxID=259542 RepID=A0AAV4DHM3_9GAST|nr:hypothetical protein PoB_006985600 [Plakobranchus ocellatus]
MLLKLIACLALAAVLVSEVACHNHGGGVFCKNWNEDCTFAKGNCCSGLTCQNVAGGWKCKNGPGGHGGSCKNRGEWCSPENGWWCCPGFTCRPKITNPNIHECW